MTAPKTAAERIAARAGKPHLCGFCTTGHHKYCPRAVRNGDLAPAKIITCDCKDEGCGDQLLRCLECKSEAQQDIDPENWRCFDINACEARIEARLDANPTIQNIRRIQTMARIENEKAAKTAAAKKTPKVGKCLVTGKATKGGKFLPGMDARYVSLRVTEVLDGSATEAAARKRIKDETDSDALVAKFDKSLRLSKEKAAKKATADKEKAAAKKAAASAKK
jgi:hypothetical protein